MTLLVTQLLPACRFACIDSAGGSLAGYKMDKRTSGLSEFQFQNIGAGIKVSDEPNKRPSRARAEEMTIMRRLTAC